LPPLERSPNDREIRASTTEMLIGEKATDAARWADFEAMRDGAAERAALVAGWVGPGSRVLDIGAGVMALRNALPPDCVYVPADLLPFDPATVVVDLNDGGFPDGAYDVAAMLDVLEFVHDLEGLMKRAAGAAPRLIVSYRPAEAMSIHERRAYGYFNDRTAAEFEALLDTTGWRVQVRTETQGLRLYNCRINR
jgi:hypothetical protein